MASVARNLNTRIARMSGVRNAVTDLAKDVETKAKANLTAHRAEGDARITRERIGNTDWLISLEDEAAVSIEYGRGAYTRGDYDVGAAEGLYVMTRAAEEASG